VNDELKMMWKETVLASSKEQSCHLVQDKSKFFPVLNQASRHEEASCA
jgi:hypothetical protein